MPGAVAGIAAGAIVLSILIAVYKKIKNISLDNNQSTTSQKLFILLRIGLFWGFWWIVMGIAILFFMLFVNLHSYIDITMDTITIVGWIVVPLYVAKCAYQLIFNSKTVLDFNKKYYKEQ